MSVASDIQRSLPLIPGGQADFVSDLTSPFISLVGGMGSGKTKALVYKSLVVGSLNAPHPFLFIEPTYGLIESVAIPVFEEVLESVGIAAHWHHRKKVLTVGVGRHDAFQIWMRSGRNPADLVGFEAAAAAIDEPGQQHRSIFTRAVQRVRHPKSRLKQVMLGGTPEGFNWFYEVCEKKPPKGMRVCRAKTTDNPFQSEEYVRNLLSTLSEEEVDAYINGRFVNLKSGRVYKAFRRETHHARLDRLLDGEMCVGCDFNVDKMTWVICVKRGARLYVVDEVVGTNTNTYRQTDALIERLKEICHREDPRMPVEEVIGRVRVYTDAAGKRRETSANESDLQILRGAGFNVVPASSNPPIVDRVHSLEAMFRSETCVVDTQKCSELTSSLEGQAWGLDRRPQKGRGAEDMSGMPDALGYLVWGHYEWRSTLPRGNRPAPSSYL